MEQEDKKVLSLTEQVGIFTIIVLGVIATGFIFGLGIKLMMVLFPEKEGVTCFRNVQLTEEILKVTPINCEDYN